MQLMKRLRKHLQRNPTLFRTQHRDGKHNRQFRLSGSFKVGTGSTQAGHLQFARRGSPNHIQHNFRNTGVFVERVKSQRARKFISAAKYKAYRLAMKIFKGVDREYCKGECLVNFSRMASSDQYVKRHVDSNDIAPQYALSLGNYQGAQLRCYLPNGEYRDFFNKNKIVKLDGRLPHEVVGMEDFSGERFSIIVYKNYDSRKTAADPLFTDPHYVPF